MQAEDQSGQTDREAQRSDKSRTGGLVEDTGTVLCFIQDIKSGLCLTLGGAGAAEQFEEGKT